MSCHSDFFVSFLLTGLARFFYNLKHHLRESGIPRSMPLPPIFFDPVSSLVSTLLRVAADSCSIPFHCLDVVAAQIIPAGFNNSLRS